MILPELVIIEVKKYPALYKLDDPNYINPQKKEECFYNIAERISLTYNLPIKKEEVKMVWEKLQKMYQENKRTYLPSGSGTPPTKSPEELDLIQQLSFLDDKVAHRPCRSSLNISSLPNSNVQKSIWNSDMTTNSPQNNFVVPQVDKFCRVKKQNSNDNLTNEMTGLMSVLKDCSTIIAKGEREKARAKKSHYKPLILELFENCTDERSCDELMLTLLKIIRNYKNK